MSMLLRQHAYNGNCIASDQNPKLLKCLEQCTQVVVAECKRPTALLGLTVVRLRN